MDKINLHHLHHHISTFSRNGKRQVRFQIIILIAVLFLSNFSMGEELFAQNSVGRMTIGGHVSADESSSQGIQLIIHKGAEHFKTVSLSRNGRFNEVLEMGSHYTLMFVKADFYKKTIYLDTSNPLIKSQSFQHKLSINLEKRVNEIPGELAVPILNIHYDDKQSEFCNETLQDYNRMSESIGRLIFDSKHETDSLILLSLVEAENAYTELIHKGDDLANDNRYYEAIKAYKDAITINSMNDYPFRRIEEMREESINEYLSEDFGVISAENVNKYISYANIKLQQNEYETAKIVYEQVLAITEDNEIVKRNYRVAAKYLTEAEQLVLEERMHFNKVNESSQIKYAKIVSEGDQLFISGNIGEAKRKYVRSLTLVDENRHAKNMISTIDLFSADDMVSRQLMVMRQQQQADAIKLARNSRYDKTVADADRSFENHSLIHARDLYNYALEIKPYEIYPSSQINLINNLILQNQRNGELYKSVIAKANQLFDLGNYSEALDQYRSAQDLNINDDNYSKDQIVKIKQILKQQYDMKSAQEKEQIIIAENQNRFEGYILEADASFNVGNLSSAKRLYSMASHIFPDQAYPLQQLNLINEIEEQVNNNDKASSITLNFKEIEEMDETEVKSRYETSLSIANEHFKLKEYSVARFYYRIAIAYKSDDQFAMNQMRLIDDRATQNSSDIDNYRELVELGDKALKAEDYSVAKFFYKKALRVREGDSYVLNQISKLNFMSSSGANEKIYNQNVSRGETALAEGRYSIARFYYRKAQEASPYAQLPRQKLNDIDLEVQKQIRSKDKFHYKENIEKADAAFMDKTYSIAKYYYRKALNASPNAEYPMGQIKRIQHITHK